MVASLAVLRCLVERKGKEALESARVAQKAARKGMSAPPLISLVGELFGLSPFERDLLLLCAGAELDPDLAAACAEANGDPRKPLPTFALALGALPGAHWSAIGPASPLRGHCLIDVLPGESLARSPLRIQERILHFLVGLDQPEERLAGFFERVARPPSASPFQRMMADRIVNVWRSVPDDGEAPIIELCGGGRSEKRAIAAAACAAVGLGLGVLDLSASGAAVEDDRLARLIRRETILGRSALLIDGEDLDERADASRWLAARRFVEKFAGPALVATRCGLRPERRATREYEIAHSSHDDRAPRDLADLAERVDSSARWDDLVLPGRERAALHEIAIHVRQREHLRERWGFAERAGRGLGVSALFAGASGTGKTLAASVLSGELGLALFRVDLSRVVSKYIGDTEKNLRRVFDAAEEADCILLFDEADALFGPRTDVKDSRDRYANLEVAYLLQRMESYRGLSILTTNERDALDPAFLRRLRFVVDFPFPAAAEREQIWRKVFPQRTPLDGIDYAALSRLNVAGGNIRNIAVAAASLAAEERKPVGMKHVWAAVRGEYGKMGREVPEGKIALEE